jgi:hypothetical protein
MDAVDNDLVKSNAVPFSYTGINLDSVNPTWAFPDDGTTVTLAGEGLGPPGLRSGSTSGHRRVLPSTTELSTCSPTAR